jgi:hypothetical protein
MKEISSEDFPVGENTGGKDNWNGSQRGKRHMFENRREYVTAMNICHTKEHSYLHSMPQSTKSKTI